MARFSISESIKFGWHKTRAHSKLLFQVVLTMLALQVAYSVVNKVLAGTVLGMLAALVLGIALAVTGVGATVIALKFAQGEHARYQDLIPPMRLIIRFLLAGLLAALISVLPLIAAVLVLVIGVIVFVGSTALALLSSSSSLTPLIVLTTVGTPMVFLGILLGFAALIAVFYFALRYSMVRFAVIDGEGIMGSLHKSTALTRGVKWHLLGFMVVIVAVNILGALIFLVGLLVSIPVSIIAYAHVYQKLLHHAH